MFYVLFRFALRIIIFLLAVVIILLNCKTALLPLVASPRHFNYFNYFTVYLGVQDDI